MAGDMERMENWEAKNLDFESLNLRFFSNSDGVIFRALRQSKGRSPKELNFQLD